jgi:H+/Cl- antiporter ClcA
MAPSLRFFRWIVLVAGIGILTGAASAALLAGLDAAYRLFLAHRLLGAGLPLFGVLTIWLYRRFGGLSERGNNLLVEEINSPSRPVPWIMAPLVFLGTLLTHLGGGSAGREGSAVQMGGAFADFLGRRFQVDDKTRRLLLMAGAGAGFSALFGTPIAGCLFGMEFSLVGGLTLEGLLPCLAAALLADRVALLCGAHHVLYRIPALPHATLPNLGWVIAAGLCFGLAARAYCLTYHGLSKFWKRVPSPMIRILLGGALVALLLAIPGAVRYSGLGVPLMIQSFQAPLLPWDFALKGFLTALTLSVGFKGGEVTPLFCVGACLGNALALCLPLPMPLLAGTGFVALFGACANTPLAAAVMGVELFGGESAPWMFTACVAAFAVSGLPGIYASQKTRTAKI